MVGLIAPQPGAPAPGAAPGAEMPAPPDDAGMEPEASAEPSAEPGAEPNVSPEEQAQYDRFIANGLRLIFEGNRDQAILARIEKGANPVEGLASATLFIVMRLKESAEKAGQQISNDVLFHGGMEIMENVAELAKRAKLHAYTPKEIEQALYVALDQYSTQEVQKGTIDKESLQQDFQMLMDADKGGKLEELLPGITAKAKELGGAGAAEEPAPEPEPEEV